MAGASILHLRNFLEEGHTTDEVVDALLQRQIGIEVWLFSRNRLG